MQPVSPLAGRRILGIDPSDGIADFLRELFEGEAADVARARSAAEARELFQPGRFDLVLMDIVLPDERGTGLLRELRRADDDCVLVVLTGGGGGQLITEAMRAGGDAYVEKQHLSGGGDNQHLRDALEHAFDHRAGVIARRRLEAMKTDFYSMVTHDLRNPAGNVLVALKLLKGGKPGPLTAQQAELVDLAFRSAGKFVGLINDYLDFARIDAGYLRVDRAPADLMAVVAASVAMARTQCELRSITLTVSGPATTPASIDAPKLEQVLDNLISNAVKYSPEGGRIEVSVETSDGRARIAIRDGGIGIPADQLGSLFTRYHRVADRATARVQGTGLGLVIVKEIVQAHDGEVTVASSGVPGEGSVFTVTLPLVDPATLPGAESSLPAST